MVVAASGSQRVKPPERVTVTMPAELVAGIDRYARNRSRFIAEAVRHELDRRQRLELLRSLEDPHPDCRATASMGLHAWGDHACPVDDSLLDPDAGLNVCWSEEHGWQEPSA